MEKLEKGTVLRSNFFGKKKLSLVTKLVFMSNEKSMEIDWHVEYNGKAWHGEVQREASKYPSPIGQCILAVKRGFRIG